MNNNRNNYNGPGGDNADEIFSWILIFVLFVAFWPLGLFLLLRKLGTYSKKSGGTAYGNQQTRRRNNTAAYRKKPEGKGKIEKSKLEKKSGKFVSTVLLLISIILFIIGANTVVGASRGIAAGIAGSWPDLLLGAFYFAGGLASFFARAAGNRRLRRFKKYNALIGTRSLVPIPHIAAAVGEPEKTVRRGLQAMIDAGYLEPGAYIDDELNSLVLTVEAAELVRENAVRRSAEEAAARAAAQPENQYMAIIRELRELNDTILDGPISDKIDTIEHLTSKIFREVEQNPSKLPQIRRFMSYYLPTTLKLLHSYATLEKQGIMGENITAAKENITKILDTLSAGFAQQLDLLFRDDAIDISADVSVIESMMRQDGLAQ